MYYSKSQIMLPNNHNSSEVDSYFLLRKGIPEMPVRLQLYFNALQSSLSGNSLAPSSKLNTTEQFLVAFSNLSPNEKAHLMNESMKYLADLLKHRQSQNSQIAPFPPPNCSEIETIQTTAYLSSTKMKIPIWTTVKFKLDKVKDEIHINSPKKCSVYGLKNYLVRKSKKDPKTVVFDAIRSDVNSQSHRKLSVTFTNKATADSVYQQLVKLMIRYRRQQIYTSLNKQAMDSSAKSINDLQSNDKQALVLLSSKNMNTYLRCRDKFIKYLSHSKLDFKPLHLKVGSNGEDIKVERSLKNRKLFRMETVKDMSQQQLKSMFLQAYEQRNLSILSWEVLETFSQKYQAVYEKFNIRNRACELISIKQVDNSEGELLIFAKSIDVIMARNFMDYFVVRVLALPNECSRLTVICSINLSAIITCNLVIDFLKELEEMIERKVTAQQVETFRIQNNQEVVADQFQTVLGEESEHSQFVETNEEPQTPQKSVEVAKIEELQFVDEDIRKGYLKKKFKLQPMHNYNIKANLMTQHYLFKEWFRRKDGGVVCTNQEIISEQKRVLKHIITSFGNKLLHGGNIMNIGLPVKVFKKQSHLYSIAKTLSFATLFLEGLHDHLERVKFATLMAISVGTLGISLDKPFNPILGETIQLWIGGCPVYLEQISHHPAICAYFFKGRGFKMHGLIEPKIKFGLKSVKGYNERPNYIQFDDGTRIQIAFGKMLIQGLLFGERLFNFDEKIYAYDTRNNLFSEINYGPRYKNMIVKDAQPMDFCYGKIYQLRPEFVHKFESAMPRPYPTKQYIVKELSEFEGIWTGAIQFDGQSYIDFKAQLPCALSNESDPLPSNSNYRKDLIKLIEGDIPQAQKEKQLLQEIQRRDQKLREQAKQQRLLHKPLQVAL